MRSRISIRGYVRPSVGRSVRRSVRPSVGHTRVEFLETPIFRLKWNKIAQKHETIPLEGQFRDKYASRSPERIWCLNSVRLVSSICMWSFFSVLRPAGPVYCEPTPAKKKAAPHSQMSLPRLYQSLHQILRCVDCKGGCHLTACRGLFYCILVKIFDFSKTQLVRDQLTDGWMDGRMDALRDGWTDGRTDPWMDWRTNGHMDL